VSLSTELCCNQVKGRQLSTLFSRCRVDGICMWTLWPSSYCSSLATGPGATGPGAAVDMLSGQSQVSWRSSSRMPNRNAATPASLGRRAWDVATVPPDRRVLRPPTPAGPTAAKMRTRASFDRARTSRASGGSAAGQFAPTPLLLRDKMQADPTRSACLCHERNV